MKNYDEYVAGEHHHRMHFWCGLVFGALLGTWVGWWVFESGWPIVVTAGAFAAGIAYSCGRWGDRAWHWIIERLPWLT